MTGRWSDGVHSYEEDEACACILLFFFSSRRRHTRCSRDWSSDVCSSDLTLSPLVRWRTTPRTMTVTALAPTGQFRSYIQALARNSATALRLRTTGWRT